VWDPTFDPTADPADLDGLVEAVTAALGPVDVLVNNAGVAVLKPFDQLTLDEWDTTMATNLRSLFLVTRAVLPGMRERGWGRIVNVASTSVREPIVGLALSNANRMAAVGEVEALAREVAADGVTVNTIATGRCATEGFAFQAEEKGLAFSAAVAAEVPAALVGDPLRLGQVLTNLLSNALKFTEHGSVSLRIEGAGPGAGCEAAAPAAGAGEPAEAASSGAQGAEPRSGNARLRFSVADTGIGIRKESLPGLFKPFSQEDQSTTRLYGGTGLGLSISKRFVELMGGELVVDSESGRGSIFSFELELPTADAVPAGAPAGAGSGAEAEARVAGALVLVVDDDPLNRRVATSFLEELGAEAEGAESGHAAITLLAKRRYDAVLMDCSMPGMDGYETTARIRDRSARALDPRVPIIAMTAHTQPEDRERCLKAGMDDYLAKPVGFQSLAEALARALPEGTGAGRKAGKGAGASPRGGEPRGGAGEALGAAGAAGGSAFDSRGLEARVFDAASFTARFSGDEAIAEEILDIFLSQTPGLFEEAKAALAAGDTQTFASLIHRLKGGVGTIGGKRVMRVADEIMDACRHAKDSGGADHAEAERLRPLAEVFGEELKRLLEEVGEYAASRKK